MRTTITIQLPATAFTRFLLVSAFLLLFTLNSIAQTNSVLPQVVPQVPQPAQFTPIQIRPNQIQQNYNRLLTPNNSLFNNGPQQQNQLQQYQQDFNIWQQQQAGSDDILNDAKASFNAKEDDFMTATASYRQAFNNLLQFNPDSFSITKAIFTIETAYFDNKLSYTQFNTALQQKAELVRQILKREGLSAKSNLALNYGIQKLYQQENIYTNKSGQKITIQPFRYDFDDYLGEKDYSKMFVSRLLVFGKGQCHSEPLNYLAIAEQLGAKAYLSLAPQHSFIRFQDATGNIRNFETTNGQIVSKSWLIQSGYIAAKALQNKTYLDTLSQRQLYAQMLGDLLLGYIAKFNRYDGFTEQVRQTILKINPNNLTAVIVGENMKVLQFRQKIQEAGKPKPEDLPKYPEAYKAFLDMKAAMQQVENMGYQDMPKEAYQKWLQSIEQEKQRQANKELKANMEREIQQIKKFQQALQKQLKQ